MSHGRTVFLKIYRQLNRFIDREKTATTPSAEVVLHIFRFHSGRAMQTAVVIAFPGSDMAVVDKVPVHPVAVLAFFRFHSVSILYLNTVS